MANWKKVIVSGSNAELAQLSLTDLSVQGSEETTLVISSAGVIGTRENAASSGTSGSKWNFWSKWNLWYKWNKWYIRFFGNKWNKWDKWRRW